MDHIIITDLMANGIIGVKHPERDVPQDLIINLVISTDVRDAGVSDSILDTINYSTVSKFVLAEVSETRFYTVEKLATHLCQKVLEQFPSAEGVLVRVEKPKAVSRTAKVGVEIYRERGDLP